MYQVKPMCGGDVKVDLPTCMYKLANIHERPPGNSCTHEHAALQNGVVDPTVKALEARQDEIMRKLYELKAAVEGLAKTVTTPDADMDLTVSSSLSSQSASFAAFKCAADLDTLLGKDLGALRDIVINANPAQPPFTLLVLHNLLCQRYRVLSTVHVHSSVSSVPPQLLSCLGPRHPDSYARHLFQLGFTLIWKDVPKLQMKFSVQNMCPIEGEASVARFLFKLLAPYPSDAALATLVDDWVDTAFLQLAEGGAKERAAVLRALNSALGRGPWLAGRDITLADVACYCCLLLSGATLSSAPANVQRWLESCENLGHFGPAKVLLQ
ncbi:LOW QUALITY PROTEIN: aminoacyl tRNA synthase complex-interacting multifunctional protein 2 [Phycodurus eques]|uniref:LOW QUALITY PROTEIN: aminoacyl tRNA synthase complex-interacting multifunctional protein 2 n=1 Tax=Phycodurus eques TaxID=693459 RepID=UPI002ACE2B93|nr:LOW QUALITY PROTEIN: aminoacyl tRNA synthase complex-interacting multifunctional protein 2 [Phycodurus eques]